MLQVPCFSPPVYGTSHYKKFWLRQTQVKDDIGLDMKSSITTGSPQRRVCTRRRMMRSALHSPPKAPDADQKSYLDAKGVSAVVEIKPKNGFLKSEAEDEDQKVKKCESGSDTDTTDCTVSSNLESIGGAETPPRLSRSGSPLRRPALDLTAHEILREEDEENELEEEEDDEENHDMGNEELKKRHHLSEDCLTSAYRVDDLECREDADHFSDDSESEKPVPATGSARDADLKAHEEQEEEEEEEDDDVGGEDLDQENENLRGDSLDSCSTDCGYVSEKNSARRSYLPSSSKAAKWKDESAKISNAISPKRRHLADGPAKASHAINSSAMANNSHNISRTCKHCGTMKTPLWRNGPLGPKSLCNACGIRLRKARRMSASNNQDTQATTSSPAKRKQDQDVGMDGSHHTYKRSRMSFIREKKEGNFGRSASFGHRSSSSKVLSSKLSTPLSTYNSRIGKSPALRRSFSKDEEEGAVLLMALSCGLVLA